MENRYKVLIADDDAHISELIALYMEKECFETMRSMYHAMREADKSYDKTLFSASGMAGGDGLLRMSG